MNRTLWLCYSLSESSACLVLDDFYRNKTERNLPYVIPIKRFPSPGETFLWNDVRWRVKDLDLEFLSDDFGRFKFVEAVPQIEAAIWEECSECGGIILCTDSCRTRLHREGLERPPEPVGPRKERPGTLDAPLREIVSRRGMVERLSCGHYVHHSDFKYVDKNALARRCLECCVTCPPRKFQRTT